MLCKGLESLLPLVQTPVLPDCFVRKKAQKAHYAGLLSKISGRPGPDFSRKQIPGRCAFISSALMASCFPGPGREGCRGAPRLLRRCLRNCRAGLRIHDPAEWNVSCICNRLTSWRIPPQRQADLIKAVLTECLLLGARTNKSYGGPAAWSRDIFGTMLVGMRVRERGQRSSSSSVIIIDHHIS